MSGICKYSYIMKQKLWNAFCPAFFRIENQFRPTNCYKFSLIDTLVQCNGCENIKRSACVHLFHLWIFQNSGSFGVFFVSLARCCTRTAPAAASPLPEPLFLTMQKNAILELTVFYVKAKSSEQKLCSSELINWGL